MSIEKDDHTILLRHPTFTLISHWSIVLLLSTAIITGFLITRPFSGFQMRGVRYLHLIVNALLAGVVIARAYYGLISGDVRNFLPRRGDSRRFIQLMAFYLFIRKTKPFEETKYNVGQRFIYSSWVFAWLFQGISGLILANPARSVFAARWLGDLQTVRLAHFFVTVYFASTILVHIYLALVSDPAKLQSIFSGYIRLKEKKRYD